MTARPKQKCLRKNTLSLGFDLIVDEIYREIEFINE